MEAEGTILISMLVEKTGLNNATLQKKVIELLLSVGSNGDLYPVQLTTLLMLKGLTSKNKTRAEILKVIAEMIEMH